MRHVQTFADANKVLEPYYQAVPSASQAYTLERMRVLIAALGNPQESLKIIHVAGTSGKTSTCYYIAAMLTQAGQKVGLTVSPHLTEVNERLQVNEVPLAETPYCAALTEFLELLNSLEVKPTYFELLIAFAYWYFAKEKFDYAVVEVGLGGLLDSTNVVTRADKVCVITDIGLDHQHVLGSTLSEIAAQKAGIIQLGNPVFYFQQAAAVNQVISDVAKYKTEKVHAIAYDQSVGRAQSLPHFQQRNWQLAAHVFDYLQVRDNLLELSSEQWRCSETTYIPGRMEIIKIADKTIILDGAHNPQKMQALAESVSAIYEKSSISALVAFKASKDIGASLKAISPVCAHIIATEFDNTFATKPVSCRAVDIAEQAPAAIEPIPHLTEAWRALLASKEPVLLVTGSFYLLQAVKALIAAK
ncbi:hypothetical protein H7Y63_01410 [Polaromonas sp.]|nr:hypothetical protein [Candidatus Saccharibacteria bacterium]